jgi:hypothetical protein
VVRALRGCGLCALGVVLSASALLPARAQAQSANKKVKPTIRLVEGTVVDKAGKPIAGAVVYLKDEKASTIKTYLAGDDGRFRFGQLSLATDYDLWSRINGKRSKTKLISMFNSKPALDYKIKINTDK